MHYSVGGLELSLRVLVAWGKGAVAVFGGLSAQCAVFGGLSGLSAQCAVFEVEGECPVCSLRWRGSAQLQCLVARGCMVSSVESGLLLIIWVNGEKVGGAQCKFTLIS